MNILYMIKIIYLLDFFNENPIIIHDGPNKINCLLMACKKMR